jgi:DNA-binding transcriptional ArsR family regulator
MMIAMQSLQSHEGEMPTDRPVPLLPHSPRRRAILALGESTISEFAKRFKMSGPAVSKHLKY